MCRNMLTDPAFAPWREQAIKRGYASSIVLPLMEEGKAFGAINIYSKDPDPFSDDEVKLLTELADDLAHGITTLRLRAAQAQAEEILENMRNILAEGQKIAHLGSFEYLAATGETVWSDEEFRIYGLEPGQHSPSYADLMQRHFHPDDAARVDQKFTATLQNGSIYEIEHRIKRPDGSVRDLYNKALPYFDENGKLVRYIGATLDITERKQAEEALRPLWNI